VRIPLDYYRILGLPIQATAEQLTQAHRDRTLQLPRREYSEVAIEARKALIDEAYTVLADAEQRREYDTQFLARAYAPVESVLEGATPAETGADAEVAAGEAALRSLATETEADSVPAAMPAIPPRLK
jgi:DnaJ-class molecular chaperone